MYYQAKHLPNKKIKIVITGGLGDCLLSTPFIHHFKNTGIYEKITCVVPIGAAQLFDKNPFIDQLIPIKGSDLFFWATPEKDSDIFSPYIDVGLPDKERVIFDVPMTHLFNLNRTPSPVIKQVAAYHNITLDNENLEIYTSKDDDKWANKTIAAINDKPIIVINPESRLKEKDLSKAFCTEIETHLKKNFNIVYIEPTGFKSSSHQLTIPLPGLRRSAALFKKVHCIITADSFPGHLAAAVDTKAIVLFGPSNPKTFGHHQNINIRTSSCPPCADTRRRVECSNSECIEDIPVNSIINAVNSLQTEEKRIQ